MTVPISRRQGLKFAVTFGLSTAAGNDYNTFAGSYGIRQGDWVLLNVGEKAPKGKLDKTWAKKRNYPAEQQKLAMLYNLKEDIGQRHDVSDKHPERVQQMTARLKDILGKERLSTSPVGTEGKKKTGKRKKKKEAGH